MQEKRGGELILDGAQPISAFLLRVFVVEAEASWNKFLPFMMSEKALKYLLLLPPPFSMNEST